MLVAVLWTLVFTLAAGFSYYNLTESKKDAAALKASRKNGPFSRVARGTVREETVRFVAFTAYALMGLGAVIGWDVLPQVYSFILVGGGVGMLFNSIQSFQTRREVFRYGDISNAGVTTQQSPSDRQARRVVRRTGRGRVGPKSKR